MQPTTTDQSVRARALAADISFIVQAPAGSGKTELLIRRYLKLLSRVDSPESIVAITFTKKAAAEMRARVVNSLLQAAEGGPPDSPHQAETRRLAEDALARDAEAKWGLLHNPARLRIQTIDALSASITRQMPWLARFGEPPQITEKARDLYHEAARNTLSMVQEEERSRQLGGLSKLLLHLDGNFKRAETLIAGMLETRDQWLRITGVNPDLPQVRAELDRALQNRIEADLAEIRQSIPFDIAQEITAILQWRDLPRTTTSGIQEWHEIYDLLFTSGGDVRVKVPKDKDVPTERCKRLYESVRRNATLAGRLYELKYLPVEPSFTDPQWGTMEALFDVLPKAVAHLQLVFRERGRVDFAELSIRASEALGHLDSPTDLALALGHRIEHLLVDEFQDTSFTQYDLLRKLTAGWEPGDGRTLFLVGDPMQSIYRFREADVSLFLKARREGIGAIELEPLTLRSNFRSDPAIVEWVNDTFESILPMEEDIGRGAVAYTSSDPTHPPSETPAAPTIHPFIGEAQAEEAARILRLIESATGSFAILVRARSHLTAVIAQLRERGIAYQAVEIDQLGERPIIQDLMALTFALTHLADRISWLAILRAPWCVLTLHELHAIAEDDKALIWDRMQTAPSSPRLARIMPPLQRALAQRGRVPLRTLIEQTWLALGGPACVLDDSELADAEAYFDLLESLQQSGDLASFASLRTQVTELFSQSATNARIQIMTIHRAKGLEFDTVILPGLGQKPAADRDRLLLSHEHEGNFLLAPITESKPGSKYDRDPIYRYLGHLEREKTRQEESRLLYVAATRARRQLHLLGCVRPNLSADTGSFLKLLWPKVGHLFVASQPNAAPGTKPAAPQRLVRRLPLDWTLPVPAPSVYWRRETIEPTGLPDEPTYEWVGDTARYAGTVVHDCLRRIAREGVEQWDTARVEAAGPMFESMLRNAGVPPVDLPEAIARVRQALLQTLADPQARWFLEPHAKAESEYEVTGFVDGKLLEVKIDRTFIDEHGTRWIVDFKTSAHEGGQLENFLEEEKRRHQPQLERYARLLVQLEDRPIRLALYFPLLGATLEWAAPTIKHRQASLFDS